MVPIEGGILERFGHHWAGELLDLERETAGARNAVAGPAVSDEVERQHVAREIKNTDVGPEPIRSRIGKRGLDDRPVFPAGTGGSEIGAVDRKMQDEQLKRGAQALARIVAGGVMAGRDPREQT